MKYWLSVLILTVKNLLIICSTWTVTNEIGRLKHGWWACSKPDPYRTWYPNITVAVDCTITVASTKKKFRVYCETTKDRWGSYYDIVEDGYPYRIRTIFKLYAHQLNQETLVNELVMMLENKYTNGGPSWTKKKNKIMLNANSE